MAVTVYIPTPYRQFTNNSARVEVREGDVLGLVRELEARYPGLHERILGPDGSVLRHLNIYVNDQPVEELQGMQTPVKDGDQVAVIPAMVGGTLAFTEEQIRRYSRHIILPEVGGIGQRRLLNSKVLLIGAGGLGSPAALYLAAAGVGTLGIVDFDVVDLSNLQRQILHHVHDVGRPKVQSAVETIGDLNPDVKVVPYNEPLSSANVKQIFSEYDVIVNGCDNFPTRYLANDACVFLRKPMVDGSIFKFEGQVTVFIPGQGCYRCLYPSPPPPGLVPSCQEAGVFGVLCGVVASIQGIETIKLLLGLGESLVGRLLFFDALGMEFRQVKIRRDKECPVCGDQPTITDLIDYHEFCGVP
ncbi:MAG TPA: molybdopterin-synthase adenylyltransferase MoeB, partial [Candidatus Acidoferrum sp.]|nr:molybdopterin-synthase adenylyltransferase MoeB [Candidatus Acidoferrum sp.]